MVQRAKYLYFIVQQSEKYRLRDLGYFDNLDGHLVTSDAMVSFEDLAELANTNRVLQLIDIVLDLFLRASECVPDSYWIGWIGCALLGSIETVVCGSQTMLSEALRTFNNKINSPTLILYFKIDEAMDLDRLLFEPKKLFQKAMTQYVSPENATNLSIS
jgi:hypothetical protein